MLSVILVEPRHPGNVGAIARAMHNFGIAQLVLVDPLCSPLDPEARRRAVHGQAILENATSMSWDQMRAEQDLLIGSTAIIGSAYNLPRLPVAPRDLGEVVAARKEQRIGLVLGRENDGLHNQELLACDVVTSIPAGKKNPTLNLSHACVIILYELFLGMGEARSDDHLEMASAADLGRIDELLDSVIEALDWATPEKQETQKIFWKRLFSRSTLTKREAAVAMGLLDRTLKQLS